MTVWRKNKQIYSLNWKMVWNFNFWLLLSFRKLACAEVQFIKKGIFEKAFLFSVERSLCQFQRPICLCPAGSAGAGGAAGPFFLQETRIQENGVQVVHMTNKHKSGILIFHWTVRQKNSGKHTNRLNIN